MERVILPSSFSSFSSLLSRFTLAAGILSALSLSATGADSRTWTATGGKSTITGSVVKYTGSEVTISTDSGKTLKIKTRQLSQEDRDWLEENKDNIGKADAPAPAEQSEVANQFTGSTSIILRGGKTKKEEPKPNAKYYIILFSASWCGPCCAEMPLIVREYNRKIKNNPDLELIHKSADKKLEDALDWAKREKIPFPTVLPGSECNASVLSLSQSSGIPSMLIVTASGEKVIEGHPARLLKSYQKEIEKYEKDKGESPAK